MIDAHLDLASMAVQGRNLTRSVRDGAMECISLPDLRDGGITVCGATIFTAPGGDMNRLGYFSSDDRQGAFDAGMVQLQIYEELEAAGHVRIIRTTDDMGDLGQRIGLVLLMEGGDPIRSPDDVEFWFQRGLRWVGMTWSRGTRYAGGNAAPGPLTDEGRDLVAAMDEWGIVHDLSHLCDEAVDDLLAVTSGHVIASHSNCRAVVGDGQRHLQDEHIEAIGQRGGIVGVNLFSKFLVPEGRADRAAVTRHCDHLAAVLGGRDRVGLGSDADGGFPPAQLPIDLDHPRCWHRIGEALAAGGWSQSEVDGFNGDNFRRHLMSTLPHH